MTSTEYTAIKLVKMSPTHIGTGRENYDFSESVLHSDAISSALAAIRAQSGEKEGICNFLQSFRISSAFPYYKDRYFLPRPVGRLKISVKGQSEYQYRKKLKNVKFLELQVWNRLINGDIIEVEESQIHKEFIVHGQLDTDSIMKTEVTQRVTVPRYDDTEASPFFFEWTYYNYVAGLYFITDAKGALLNEIVSLFRQLGETGIGTDKCIGGGKFDVETTQLFITTPEVCQKHMLLSMYIPNKNEFEHMDLSHSSYKLCLRNGYIAGSENPKFYHLKKKSVFMFTEGSVIHSKEAPEGKIVNLRPEWNDIELHDVFRSGKALSIPFSTE